MSRWWADSADGIDEDGYENESVPSDDDLRLVDCLGEQNTCKQKRANLSDLRFVLG